MTIDGNSIVILAAAVAVLAGIGGAVWKITAAFADASKAAKDLPALALRMTTLEQQMALMKQASEAHDKEDTRMFAELKASNAGILERIDDLRETLYDVLVRLGVRGRDGRDPKST